MVAVEAETMKVPVDSLVLDLPRIDLDAERARRFSHGQGVLPDEGNAVGDMRVYADQAFLGVATINEAGMLAPRRLLVR